MKSRDQCGIIKKAVLSTDRKLQTPIQLDSHNITYQDFTSKRFLMFRSALYKNTNFTYDKNNRPRSISPIFKLNPGRKLFKSDQVYNISPPRMVSKGLQNYPNGTITRQIRKPYIYSKKTKPKLTSSRSTLIKLDDMNSFITLGSRSITPNTAYITQRFRENSSTHDFEEVAPPNEKAKDSKQAMNPASLITKNQSGRRYSGKRSSLNEEIHNKSITDEYERLSSYHSHSSINILIPRISPVNDNTTSTPVQKIIDKMKDKEITYKRVIINKIK